jgi:hypothetical protein
MFPGSAAASSQNARRVIRLSFRRALKNEAKLEWGVLMCGSVVLKLQQKLYPDYKFAMPN